MTIPIHCPKCGGFKPAPDQWAGKLVQCDDCGAQFKIPAKGAKRGKKREGKPTPRTSPDRATPTRRKSTKRPRSTVTAPCDACGRQYQVPSELAGRHCRCIDCGAAVEVPFPLTEAHVLSPPRPSTKAPRPAPVSPSQPQPEPSIPLSPTQPVPSPKGPLDGLLEEDLLGGPAVPAAQLPASAPADSPFAPSVRPMRPRRKAARDSPRWYRPFWKGMRPTLLGFWLFLVAATLVECFFRWLIPPVGTALTVLLLPLTLGSLLVGLGMMAFGGLWMLGTAFEEDVVCGLLWLFVPFYSLYYLISRREAAPRPYKVTMIGCGLVFAFLSAMLINLVVSAALMASGP